MALEDPPYEARLFAQRAIDVDDLAENVETLPGYALALGRRLPCHRAGMRESIRLRHGGVNGGINGGSRRDREYTRLPCAQQWTDQAIRRASPRTRALGKANRNVDGNDSRRFGRI